MATTGPEDRERFTRAGASEREKSIKILAGGSVTEAVCGAATVVLAILGLAGLIPGPLASIATITFGVALLAQGGAIAARYQRLVHSVQSYEWDTRTELGGGMGAEFLAGGAGVVLGILGLLGLATSVLIPIAVIVFGAALLLGSGATADISTITLPGETHEHFAHVARQASAVASGGQVLIGLGAIVLGIIALIGVDTALVSLVALLVLGASVLFTGTALSSRMATVLKR